MKEYPQQSQNYIKIETNNEEKKQLNRIEIKDEKKKSTSNNDVFIDLRKHISVVNKTPIKNERDDERKHSGIIQLDKKQEDLRRPSDVGKISQNLEKIRQFEDKQHSRFHEDHSNILPIKSNQSPDINKKWEEKKNDKKLSDLLKLMNKNVGKNINFDMKKLGIGSDKSPVISPKNLKYNDIKDYLNAHKMFVELNVIFFFLF